jgi:hypothetical protein
MWVLTGEPERFCGIHIGGKSIRIVDEPAGRGDDRLNRSTVPPVVIGVTCTAAIMRWPTAG